MEFDVRIKTAIYRWIAETTRAPSAGDIAGHLGETPAEVRAVAARVQVPPGAATSGPHPIQFEVRAEHDERVQVREKSTFLIPR